MKVIVSLAASLLLLQQTNGCDQPQQKPAEQPKPQRPPTHRFEAVPTVGAQGIALDTVTGQWCRTWDWMPRDPKAPVDGLNTIPTCFSLFQSQGSAEDPLGILNQSK
jgi:hypothetical protein